MRSPLAAHRLCRSTWRRTQLRAVANKKDTSIVHFTIKRVVCRILFVSLSLSSRFGYAYAWRAPAHGCSAIGLHFYQQKHSPANAHHDVSEITTRQKDTSKKKKNVATTALPMLCIRVCESARVNEQRANGTRRSEIDVKCFSSSFMNAACNFMSCTLINS